ncbi:hypothetical protein TOPH_02886 [Tolypocladium ophioglossoides CBS 100239]|uniref:Uncharacterized protein n=1 Tax=Tolypocladium ophioglossoides (strain CBS 100239) TaxID=1163406 RepID=A0A0L0NFA3_TOLOC|nr:hypothetical protein TOPH_02886 [Tolypocladium ophioglossoides CBS 100239]
MNPATPPFSSMTDEQKADFETWLSRHRVQRTALLGAHGFLQAKYGQSFAQDEVASLVDDVFAARAAAAAPEPEPAAATAAADDVGPLKRPGFGLPLGFLPDYGKRFPVLMGDQNQDWAAATVLIREVCMLKVIEDLTNKPEWWRKVRDPEIAARWKAEALAMDWPAYREHADFTPAMADACIDEILKKADLYEQTGLIPVFDYSACVIKSDMLLPGTLRDELMAAVKPLEDVPEDKKDWHPGSDGKVLDLVHPSLWPLLYGRSRILPDKRINVSNCLNHCGLGDVVPVPDSTELSLQASYGWHGNRQVPSLSARFQWLPCDVRIDDSGRANIDSYINNLHPVEHAGLYPIIERFVEQALPAWDVIYRWPEEFRLQRLQTKVAGPKCSTPALCRSCYECRPSNRPLNDGEAPREDGEEYNDGYDESERGQLDMRWYNATHPPDVPDACIEAEQKSATNKPRKKRFFHLTPDDVKTSGFFAGAPRIQVIVKLANIHLTPEWPTYDGGSWHVEGQLNEHICATALFYYDSDNITDSRLGLRTPANAEGLSIELDYAQNDWRSIARTFALEDDAESSTLQDVGAVLTQPGRALFFPNLFQHRVQPFSRADASRPGHRKILALFLVDPAVPVISTANVPPQQRHWWAGDEHVLSSRLPPELANMVLQNVDYVIDEDEARAIREELMAERTVLQDKTTGRLENVQFSFCEH